MAELRGELVAEERARRAQLAANLAEVRAGIGRACAAAGRDPAGVTLVAVTKTWPASDVAHLAALGLRELGENRDAEASAKVAECAAAGLPRLRWHFVGQVQTNKTRSLATYADVVHSVDRARLVDALSAAATEAGRTLRALIQVDLDPPGTGPGRGGAAPAEVAGLADRVADAPGLELKGVMAVAPRGLPPGPAFARLGEISAALQEQFPEAGWISSGMSGDMDIAIRMGATHVRVGSRLLGTRGQPR